MESKGKPFNKRKATTDHWYSIAVGSSLCHVSIDLVNKEHFVRVGLWINDSKDLFDKFLASKDEIEKEMGMALDWDRLDGKKASVICMHIPGLDFNNQDNYPELMNEIIEVSQKFRETFSKRI